jgi:hypothetical protein
MNFCLKPELTKYKDSEPPQLIRWRPWILSAFGGSPPDRVNMDPSAGFRLEANFLIGKTFAF